MSTPYPPLPANPKVAHELVIDGELKMPVITTFEEFVEWRASDACPEKGGRFSYLAGTIWIEPAVVRE